MPEKTIETDVLVMGGGLAGCFAAVRAKELNADVTLVEKNYAGKSGSSHYARDLMLFNEDWGDDKDAWMDQFSRIGEYVADRRWDEILLEESYDRYRDLISWGVPFYKKDDTVGFPDPGEEPKRILCRKTKYRYTNLISKFGTRDKMLIARKKVIESGAKVLDRVMITDILKQDGNVGGAVGFNMVNGDFYLIKAKAIVVASGGLGYRAVRYGTESNTGDGVAMSYRAGAELTSMEFANLMWVAKNCDTVVIDGPVGEIGLERDKVTNAKGEEFLEGFPHYPTNILWALEFHAGRGPIFHEPYGVNRELFKDAIKVYEETAEGPWITMLDRAGIDIFKDRFEQYMAFVGSFWEGGVRINTKCETNVPGLYAAGDSSGTNFTGPTYAALGSGMAGAAVTGYRAGQSAAQFALDAEGPSISESEIARFRDSVNEPLKRESGFSTDHVLTRVQQTILPYEVRMVMHEKRLQAALTMIEFFRDHFLPKLRAVNTHDLRKAHEVRNIMLGAEMQLRAALFRTESRGSFYREDYPRRDDENWLKWVMLKEEDGKMKLWTEPVPKEYWGDTSLSHEERYPLQYQA
ncbi:MAG: FAD-binding protein [Deltaproteobacteria bacterium]|nr:FAD-binding protein [Deltaproteobacteria bacterium]